jgi:hypothetical protein
MLSEKKCSEYAGSRLYNTSTGTSDLCIRLVFLNGHYKLYHTYRKRLISPENEKKMIPVCLFQHELVRPAHDDRDSLAGVGNSCHLRALARTSLNLNHR